MHCGLTHRPRRLARAQPFFPAINGGVGYLPQAGLLDPRATAPFPAAQLRSWGIPVRQAAKWTGIVGHGKGGCRMMWDCVGLTYKPCMAQGNLCLWEKGVGCVENLEYMSTIRQAILAP